MAACSFIQGALTQNPNVPKQLLFFIAFFFVAPFGVVKYLIGARLVIVCTASAHSRPHSWPRTCSRGSSLPLIRENRQSMHAALSPSHAAHVLLNSQLNHLILHISQQVCCDVMSTNSLANADILHALSAPGYFYLNTFFSG